MPHNTRPVHEAKADLFRVLGHPARVRALELLREGKRERLVRTHAAEGKPFDHGLFEAVVEDWPEATIARARELAATGVGWLDPET